MGQAAAMDGAHELVSIVGLIRRFRVAFPLVFWPIELLAFLAAIQSGGDPARFAPMSNTSRAFRTVCDHVRGVLVRLPRGPAAGEWRG